MIRPKPLKSNPKVLCRTAVGMIACLRVNALQSAAKKNEKLGFPETDRQVILCKKNKQGDP